jgi:wobble nucleotide-excising tRNase
VQKKEKLEKELRNAKEASKKTLLQSIHSLELKINHIRVVIHEIEDYSVRSCRAFFSGNTEESLRILYLKDDPVMRKKYYFDSALDLVSKM